MAHQARSQTLSAAGDAVQVRQRRRNRRVLLVLVLIVAGLYAAGMLKMAGS